jgi:hypothetical protein
MISLRIQALYICCSEHNGSTSWSKICETARLAGNEAISIDDHILGENLILTISAAPRRSQRRLSRIVDTEEWTSRQIKRIIIMRRDNVRLNRIYMRKAGRGVVGMLVLARTYRIRTTGDPSQLVFYGLCPLNATRLNFPSHKRGAGVPSFISHLSHQRGAHKVR